MGEELLPGERFPHVSCSRAYCVQQSRSLVIHGMASSSTSRIRYGRPRTRRTDPGSLGSCAHGERDPIGYPGCCRSRDHSPIPGLSPWLGYYSVCTGGGKAGSVASIIDDAQAVDPSILLQEGFERCSRGDERIISCSRTSWTISSDSMITRSVHHSRPPAVT